MTRREVEANYQQVKPYEQMVAMAAWEVWRKLPSHTRIWISVEDMVNDGMGFIIMHVFPRWDEDKATLSTLIFHSAFRFFQDAYLRHFFYRKRNEIGVHSLDGLEAKIPGAADWVVGSRDEREERMQKLFVVAAMKEIYRDASPELRIQIKRWFFSGKRVHVKTREFRNVGDEFREHANRMGLRLEDCSFLMNQPECMGELGGALGV